ncbi:MAG: prolyl oligopeptidase family serine peptidase [Proteobacteria bacterium]|nr:prolyl oligopeptidase family serine peptidase [Pseudomonadota bacterium]
MVKQLHYGAWHSPISSELIVAQSIGLSGICSHEGQLFWAESRPQEGGRNVIVTRTSDGATKDLTPEPFNVRSTVHEYGGDAWLIAGKTLYFVNFEDQQIYQQPLDAKQGTRPEPLTRSPGLRFANGVYDKTLHRLIYVVEDHTRTGEPANYLAAVHAATGEVTPLAAGHDFYSSPTLRQDGAQLAWITWDHPNMPWDETALWTAAIDATGNLKEPRLAAGGAGSGHAVQQPRYAPDGTLYHVSDANGWWNLYHGSVCICPMESEFGLPPWGFGLRTYQFADRSTVVATILDNNQSRLVRIDVTSGAAQTIDQPYTDIGGIHLEGERLTYVAASPTRFSVALSHDLASNRQEVIKRSSGPEPEAGYLSAPEAIGFPTPDGGQAHAFFYPPKNRDFVAHPDERPPLIVFMHGGPTGATHNALNLKTQFWTSRGFAIVDINYRGSSGYGRAYRDKLLGQWGVVDVQDTVACTDFLTSRGDVDAGRLAIRGASAGGYTVLAALAFHDTFKAGASHYGIGDLETLAQDTHKFESRYLDSIVGPYPTSRKVYRERSPVHHVGNLSAATIFFQGLQDKVVPPNQAETMVAALKAKDLPVAYVPFEGEQHGFRRAENIKRALDLELYFYGRVFGFEPADHITPVEIHNLPD